MATAAPQAIPAVACGDNAPVARVRGYFLEANGTIFHGKRLSVELRVRVLACLARPGHPGHRARVFEVAPTTVLPWWGAAAEQLQAFTRYLLCDVHVDQLQLDAW